MDSTSKMICCNFYTIKSYFKLQELSGLESMGIEKLCNINQVNVKVVVGTNPKGNEIIEKDLLTLNNAWQQFLTSISKQRLAGLIKLNSKTPYCEQRFNFEVSQ